MKSGENNLKNKQRTLQNINETGTFPQALNRN